MSVSNQMTQQDQRTDRANTIVGMVVGCVLLGVGGFVLLQNSASLKLPSRDKLWADAWRKELAKSREMPKAEGAIDWSDPKYDPNKLTEQPWAKENPLFQELRDQRPSNTWRR
jgi:hypothetical protein